MKSRVKLDIGYENQPEIKLEVYKSDHPLDKLLNNMMDETFAPYYKSGDMRKCSGFLIEKSYLDNSVGEGSERESSYRGTFSFVPLSRKIERGGKYEDEGDQKLQDETYTKRTISTAELSQSIYNCTAIRKDLELFNLDTTNIDFIIDFLESLKTEKIYKKDN